MQQGEQACLFILCGCDPNINGLVQWSYIFLALTHRYDAWLDFLGPLLTLIDFNTAWISTCTQVWDDINYPFPNLKGAAVEVWEWKYNSIPHFTGHVFTYPWWNFSYSMLWNRPMWLKMNIESIGKLCVWILSSNASGWLTAVLPANQRLS